MAVIEYLLQPSKKRVIGSGHACVCWESCQRLHGRRVVSPAADSRPLRHRRCRTHWELLHLVLSQTRLRNCLPSFPVLLAKVHCSRVTNGSSTVDVIWL